MPLLDFDPTVQSRQVLSFLDQQFVTQTSLLHRGQRLLGASGVQPQRSHLLFIAQPSMDDTS